MATEQKCNYAIRCFPAHGRDMSEVWLQEAPGHCHAPGEAREFSTGHVGHICHGHYSKCTGVVDANGDHHILPLPTAEQIAAAQPDAVLATVARLAGIDKTR